MSNQTIQRSSPPPFVNPPRVVVNASLPIWLRIGIPALLAMLAGILNAIAVSNQLHSIEAISFSTDVTPGLKLRADHLELVTVGGNLDRSKLFTMNDLLATLKIDDRSMESIQDALARTPLIYARAGIAGELMTASCLGGIEQPGPGEGIIDIPVANILGDCSRLTPGQMVSFNAFADGSEKSYTNIGPFRIPFSARQETRGERDALLPLVYKREPRGEKSESVQKLFAAAHSQHGVKLAIVAESPQ